MVWKYHNHTLNTDPQHREKSHRTTVFTRRQEDKQSKATSSLFPIKMIAKLEMTQSNTKQNIEQSQNPTMGAAINNESKTSYHITSQRCTHTPNL